MKKAEFQRMRCEHQNRYKEEKKKSSNLIKLKTEDWKTILPKWSCSVWILRLVRVVVVILVLRRFLLRHHVWRTRRRLKWRRRTRIRNKVLLLLLFLKQFSTARYVNKLLIDNWNLNVTGLEFRTTCSYVGWCLIRFPL